MAILKNIWLIFGLSGSGKTYFCDYLCKRNNWLHFNFDRSGLDMDHCLDFYGLKSAWAILGKEKMSQPLIAEIVKKFENVGKYGGALSFPSGCFFDIDTIKMLVEDANVVFLTSTKINCLTAFLKREELQPRVPAGVDKVLYWNKYNVNLFDHLSAPAIAPYRFNTFNEDGTRKSVERIYNEIISSRGYV